MKDFFSKFTFGFLIAQVVPGAIVIVALTLVYELISGPPQASLLGLVAEAKRDWGANTDRRLAFLAAAVFAGMLVHGLHWTVLGFLETEDLVPEDDERYPVVLPTWVRSGVVADTFCHRARFAYQLGFAPVKLLIEIVLLLIYARDPRKIAIEENTHLIDKDHMAQFQWLQDFYLHFAQFFAHTSYALVTLTAAVIWVVAELGATPGRIFAAALCYLLCGLCFVIARVQLASLYKNVRALRTPERVPMPPI